MKNFISKVMQIFSQVNPTSTAVNQHGLTDTRQLKESPTVDGTPEPVSQTKISTSILSKDFPLHEFTNSNTATRLGIENIPNEEEVARLRVLAKTLLQPLRSKIKKPVIITSGFRCLELNRSIGSKDSSQHRLGEAVDIYVPGYTALALAKYIRDNFTFDQLILENYEGPGTGWVHVSKKQTGNRNQVLTFDGLNYKVGIVG